MKRGDTEPERVLALHKAGGFSLQSFVHNGDGVCACRALKENYVLIYEQVTTCQRVRASVSEVDGLYSNLFRGV